jgi:Lrp/AsnC family leucine-responsive transcriptional regulator
MAERLVGMAFTQEVVARFMIGRSGRFSSTDLTSTGLYETIFRQMPPELDSIDLKLLEELQTDAARPNVVLARLVGLSPAATLHRVRRLKESGMIRSIAARLDSTAAGFPLQVYVAVSLERHDDTAHRRFNQAVRAMPEVISADWVTGETDAMLLVVAREVAELQRVLVRLSTRGGAARVTTLLRLEELKPASPLPLEATR